MYAAFLCNPWPHGHKATTLPLRHSSPSMQTFASLLLIFFPRELVILVPSGNYSWLACAFFSASHHNSRTDACNDKCTVGNGKHWIPDFLVADQLLSFIGGNISLVLTKREWETINCWEMSQAISKIWAYNRKQVTLQWLTLYISGKLTF
jgi:hypothetical protein